MQTERLELVATDSVVTLDEVKRQLNVEHDDDDAIIQRHIVAAIAFAEARLGRSLRLRRFKALASCWPVYKGRYMFAIDQGPVRQIEAVEYIDSEGVKHRIAPDQWQIAPHNGGHMFKFLMTPPAADHERLDAVSVTYLAGFGVQPTPDPSAQGFPYILPIVLGVTGSTELTDVNDLMPDNIRQAIYMLAAHWYENREAVAVGTINSKVALAAEDLLHQERVLGL